MTKPFFEVGQQVISRYRPDRPIKVTPVMYEATVRLRSALIVAAQRRSTMTYEQASNAIDGLFPKQGLGKPLDLLSEDCARREEPSLASLVISKTKGKVGSAFVGDADAERERCYARPEWR